MLAHRYSCFSMSLLLWCAEFSSPGAFSAAPPCAGMHVLFEIYCGFTINTTLTTLAFGASP